MKINSIGNDIVAWANTNAARTQQPKFYSKFLLDSEIALYKKGTSLSFEQFIWLCWSIKESVYKFQQRLQPDLAFAAGKINIRQINEPLYNQDLDLQKNFVESNCLSKENSFTSLTAINGDLIYSNSFITAEFIYTITADEQQVNNVFWGIKRITHTDYVFQSQSVREFITQKIIDVLDCSNPDILKTETGCPYIKQYPHIPVSFTHHHNFIGYAFLLRESAITSGIIEHSVVGH